MTSRKSIMGSESVFEWWVPLTFQITILANENNNDQGSFYYVPEFEMVLKHYQGLKPDPTALD